MPQELFFGYALRFQLGDAPNCVGFSPIQCQHQRWVVGLGRGFANTIQESNPSLLSLAVVSEL